MKNSSFRLLATWVALVVLLPACQDESVLFDGPGLVDRFGPLTVNKDLIADRSTVDFSAGQTVVFCATFNKNIDFILRITGDESGAVKIIEGFGKELNAENATWTGKTTELPLFRAETCSVELIIPEDETLNQRTSVEIVGTKIYEGALFADFEEDPGSDIFFGNFEFEFTNNTGRISDGKAAQGDYYYYLEGTDNVNPDNYFVGLIDIKASLVGETYIPVPTTAPEELYFNCFMLADGGPHGIAVIQFITDSNDSGAFEDGEDEVFQLDGDFPLNWEGWRHINHTMAEVNMTEEQIRKLVAIRLLLISNQDTQPAPPLPVDYGVDFLTFTAGKPLEL